MTFNSIPAIAVLVFLGVMAPVTLSAQEQVAIAAEDVTDMQVEAFVKAAIALEELRRRYTTQIANAETEEAQNELRAEADRVAVQLVDKVKGMTAQEYVQISKAAQDSPELAGRIAAQIEVMRAQKAEFEEQQAEAAKAREAQRAAEAQAAAEATKQDAAAE